MLDGSTGWPEGLTVILMGLVMLAVGHDAFTSAYWAQHWWDNLKLAGGMWLVFRVLDLAFAGPSRRRIQRALDEQAKRHREAAKNGYKL